MTNELKCKNCKPPVRHVECHFTCEYYIKWNKKHQNDLKIEYRNKWLESISRSGKSNHRKR